jgi:hypothetical protein
MMKNDVLDANYSMLLGHPWLQNAKVMHDWGNNLINIEGNCIICTIIVTKHLDNNTKHPEVPYFATILLMESHMKRKTCIGDRTRFVRNPHNDFTKTKNPDSYGY